MKSHALLRTNVGLTSNVKLMVGNTYSLYLDSIVSTPELGDVKYKKFQFSKNNYWDELVPYFFKGTPIDVAFRIKYDNDNDNMKTDFSKQYDDIYQYGARNIVDNKDYNEDYEFFAPLYIHKTQLPKQFCVFRIDGPGLISLTKDNFRTEILNKLKCVQVFDMTRKSALGEWLDNNITNNKSFPISSFYMDYRKNEFSSWFGVDYEDGGYSEKAFMLDAILEYENTYHDFEKMVFDGFRNNKVIFPHIINFSFLFNDTPATPTSLRKWSLNRYMGFYMDDLELVTNVSPYQLPVVKSDVVIGDNNILSSPSGNPFVETFKSNDYPYIEIGGNFYKVSKYVTTTTGTKKSTTSSTSEEVIGTIEVIKYKIISNISLKGKESQINQNLINITSTDGLNLLSKYDGGTYSISDFDDSDVWMIKIDDSYHNIVKGTNDLLYINTDYAFSQSIDKFDYYINDPDPNYRRSISLIVDDENPPKTFGIYRCRFSDVKDFDTDIVDTQFSKYEYAKKLEVTLSDETKMHTINHQSSAFPKDLNDYKVGGVVTNLPAASEYTANGETFRIVNDELSTLWRKNPQRSKWGFKGSLSSNDYPYLLNNSFSAEDYNRTTNVHSVLPKRTDRNLDYFLTVNSASVDYSHHSLHVEDIQNGVINTNFKFELDKYLGLNYTNDYFSYFFGKKSYYDSSSVVANTSKYSYFNIGDNSVPNSTLFRGIKFNLYNVESIKVTDGDIETINLKNKNEFEGFKFSIILSKNNYSVNSSVDDVNLADIKDTDNILRWSIIDMWKSDKIYPSGSVVSFYDILYQSVTQSQITDPTIDPSNSSDWTVFTTYLSSTYSTIFWNPTTFNGSDNTISNNMYNQFGSNIPPLVYNSGEYYYSSGVYGNTFWNPQSVYGIGDVVLFNNNVWVSATTSNVVIPQSTANYNNDYWSTSTSTTIWSVVELWDINFDYNTSNSEWNTSLFDLGHYVLYDNVIYMTVGNPSIGVIPPNDSSWKRIYSLSADTNFNYGPSLTQNPIILHNNRYYWCYELSTSTASVVNQTLENGIYIIINKKYKNVLVNIYVNDNTYDRLSNVNRDDLYYDVYSKLTAFNFINSVNDLSNKYDFSDKIKYIVVETDGSVGIWDFNNLNSISSIPYLLKCEGPDEFISRIKSLDVKPVTLNSSQIKINKKLQSGNIVTLDQLNHYSDINLATSIERRTDDNKLIPNYSGLQNATYNVMNRHSGPYDPIFHTVHLFKSTTSDKDYGNSKFDLDLTDFGMIKERTVSKVNRKKNILKLKNNTDLKSIYPMLDEYGYHTISFFIFKSTWDFEYHIECVESPIYQVANQSVAAAASSNKTVVYPITNNGTNTNNLTTL